MTEQEKTSRQVVPGKHDFKFSQVFGDKLSMEKTQEQDIISALEFDRTGKYLALGDRAGRLILFEENELSKGKGSKYQYMTELQSHVKEFDYLKSTDIYEKINAIQWLSPQARALQLISTNDKTIKIWKMSDKEVKRPIQESPLRADMEAKDIQMPTMEVVESGWVPSLTKTFPNLHQYLINSISVAVNEEYLISNDDLKIYLWDLNMPHKAYNVLDIKPDNLDDVMEIISCSKFHPAADHLFMYATSQGQLSLCDLRKSNHSLNTDVQFTNPSDQPRNFFTDFVESIGDITFHQNGRYIVSRDFLTIKLWDINMPNKPVTVTNIYEPIKSKLCELYENEQILEKFSVSCGTNSTHVVTGNFNNTFHLVNTKDGTNLQYELNFKQKNLVHHIPQKHFEMLGHNYSFDKKVNRCCFHPSKNILSVACLNTLFFYQAV